MKVQSVNNKCNVTFNAKFIVGGNINDIPKKYIVEWTDKLNSLGTKSDVVILHLGSIEKRVFKKYLFGLIPQRSTKQSRQIFAVAQVNGLNCDKDLSYVHKDETFNADKYLKDTIDSYINGLFKK